MLGIIFRDH